MKGHNYGICKKCGKHHLHPFQIHNFGLCTKCGKTHRHPMKGVHHSEESRKNIGASRIGKKLSAEIRQKISNSLKGKMRGKNHPFYGKEHSQKSKKRMSLAHKKFCQSHDVWNKGLTKETDDVVRNISNALKGRKLSEEHKKNIKIGMASKGSGSGMSGKVMPEEGRKKISRAHRGEKNFFYGKKHTETSRRKMREARLHTVFPFKDTSIEVALQQGLKEKGITNFEKHFPVFGQPDIAFPSKKIAVFADGDYWHSTPKAKKRDQLVNNTLSEKGWDVLRFWGHEIREKPDSCIKQIEEMLYAIN